MALETPEDSLLKTNQKVDDSAENKTAQKGGAAAQAASALMDLAEGGAVGGQTQKQGGAAGSTKYTQTRKPAFEFSAQKSQSPRRFPLGMGARPKTTAKWPAETTEGFFDDSPGPLGLQPLGAKEKGKPQPDKQPGDELREALKKAQTLEAMYIELQRERDQLEARAERGDGMCNIMVKDHAQQADEIRRLKEQLAAAQAAQLSPAMKVGMADSQKLQQAVAEGSSLVIQGGSQVSPWRPLTVVITSANPAASTNVAQASPAVAQQAVLTPTGVQSTKAVTTTNVQTKTYNLNDSIVRLNQQGYAVVRMPNPQAVATSNMYNQQVNPSKEVRFQPTISHSKMSTPRPATWGASPITSGCAAQTQKWVDESFLQQQMYNINAAYQPPAPQQSTGYVPPVTVTTASQAPIITTPPVVSPLPVITLGEQNEQVEDAQERVARVHKTSDNRRNIHTILPKPYKSGDFIAFKEGFEQISRINEWDDKTKTGQLVWCLQQGPADIIVSSRPGHNWVYEELMQAGVEMFGCAISESKMRLELKQIKRKKDESLPELTRRIINVSKRAFHMSEYRRFEEERTAFMNAVEDNRPLYYYLDRNQSSVTTLSGLLSLAMKYCNNEGASDDWVLSLLEKELESRGLAKKESDDKVTPQQNKTSSKDEKTDAMNAFMFGDRHKPSTWQDGYKLITDRLNEDLSFRKQQHLDSKVAAQRQAEALEQLKRSVEESKRIYQEQAAKPYQYGAPQRGPRPQNHGWTSGYQPRQFRPRHQGHQTQHRPYNHGQSNRGQHNSKPWHGPRHQGHGQGHRPPRHQSSMHCYQEEYPTYWGAEEDYYGYDEQQYYCYEACCYNEYSYDAPAPDNTSNNGGEVQTSATTPTEPAPASSE